MNKFKIIIVSFIFNWLLFGTNYLNGQVIPIRDIRQNDANGVPLLLNQYVTFTGIVSVANQFGSSGPGYVFDNTGGVAIYGSAVSQITIGDSVTVTGLVTHFYGLTEITNLTITKHASNRPVAPVFMTIPEVSRIDTVGGYVENEGTLIFLNDIFFASPTGYFTANTNYTIKDTLGNSCQIRIDDNVSSIIGQPIPTDTFDLVGVIAQYDNLAPYFSGYQIMPRSINDFDLPIVDTLPLMTIAEVQRPGADGYSSFYENQYVKVKGRITGPANIFTSGSNKSLYIQDETNGVNVYGPTYFTGFESFLDKVGAEWYCNGKVTEYNGLTEIAYGWMWIADTNIIEVVPQELPYNVPITEGMESKLIQVTGSVITEPAVAGAGQNFTLKNGIPGITIRILDASGIPVNQFTKGKKFRITGIVGQYTSTPPFNTGYQVMPRFVADIVDLTDSIPPSEILRIDTIYPNPFSPTDADPLRQYARIKINSPLDYKIYLEIYDMKGRLVKRLLTNQPGGFADVIWDGTNEKLEPCPIGIYILNLKGITSNGKNVMVRKPIVIATKL
ncbi:MAG: hypothetical protein ABIK19_05545 [candidate division WOR-3 bacterium]